MIQLGTRPCNAVVCSANPQLIPSYYLLSPPAFLDKLPQFRNLKRSVAQCLAHQLARILLLHPAQSFACLYIPGHYPPPNTLQPRWTNQLPQQNHCLAAIKLFPYSLTLVLAPSPFLKPKQEPLEKPSRASAQSPHTPRGRESVLGRQPHRSPPPQSIRKLGNS